MGVAQYFFTLVLLLPKISAPDVHKHPSLSGSPLPLRYTGSNSNDIEESFEKRGRRGSLLWFDRAKMWQEYHVRGFQAAASKLGLRCAASVKEFKKSNSSGKILTWWLLFATDALPPLLPFAKPRRSRCILSRIVPRAIAKHSAIRVSAGEILSSCGWLRMWAAFGITA